MNPFLIIPAIDLKDHQVVRLSQGRMKDAVVYSADPLAVAGKWIGQGGQRIHLVDLNGAFEGKPVHFEEVRSLVQKYPKVVFEIGGGIRSMDTVDQYFTTGVHYCILGTAAVKDAAFLKEAATKYPGKIIVGIDAKDGLIAVEGWDQASRTKAQDFAASLGGLSIESIIYTDIAKDGMLQGMNIPAIAHMAAASPHPIIASGGLTSEEDIKSLAVITNVMGVIVGKALYEGKIDLEVAVGKFHKC